MTDNLFWRNRIIESGAANPQELAKGYNPDNWRHHPQIQRDALEDALDSIGVLQPVLFNRLSGKVIDGHLRIELAILKGQPLIPVNYVELTDDEEALALATLDAITEQAEPIADKLAALLERTRGMTADRPGLGAMLERLKQRAGINGHQKTEDAGPQIDKAAELQKVWGVKVGDVFEIGQHRLICGDCTNRAIIEAAMKGDRADMLYTDPPYNTGETWGGLQEYRGHTQVKNDSREDWQVWAADCLKGWLDVALGNDIAGYWWFGNRENPRGLIERAGLEIRGHLVWVKEHFNVGRADYHSQYEACQYFSKGDRFWNGARDQSDVRRANRVEEERLHPTQKPLSLICGMIEQHRVKLIFDPFLGSGTTMVAAHQLNRRCFGIEIEPSYVAVTLERMSNLGQTPRRVSG